MNNLNFLSGLEPLNLKDITSTSAKDNHLSTLLKKVATEDITIQDYINKPLDNLEKLLQLHFNIYTMHFLTTQEENMFIDSLPENEKLFLKQFNDIYSNLTFNEELIKTKSSFNISSISSFENNNITIFY